MTLFERWTLAVAGVAAVTNIIVFGTLIWQLRLVRIQVRDTRDANTQDHERRRKQATIEFIADTIAQLERLRVVLPHDRNKARLREILAAGVEGDEGLNRTIAEYLTLHTVVAIGVQQDIFDVDVVDQVMGFRIMAMAENYGDWIAFMREKLAYPEIYADIENLSAMLKLRRGIDSTNPRRAEGVPAA